VTSPVRVFKCVSVNVENFENLSWKVEWDCWKADSSFLLALLPLGLDKYEVMVAQITLSKIVNGVVSQQCNAEVGGTRRDSKTSKY